MELSVRSKAGIAASAAATFAALLASYSAFRPVRDALIVDGDPEKIPWLFLATFIAVSVVSPAWSALLARRAPRGFVAKAFHAFAACAVVFFVVLRAEIAPLVVGRVFYIWSSVFNMFVVSVFWSLLADLLGPHTARELYGPIAAGGTVGALLGPVLTRLLVGAVGVAGILMITAVLLELAVIGVGLIRRAAEGSTRAPAPAGSLAGALASATRGEAETLPPGGPLAGVAHVARSPYLAAILGYVLCTAFAATFLYLTHLRIVHDAHLDRVTNTKYFASIDIWTQIVVLALQVVVVGPALRWLGPGVVLAVLPVAQAVGLSVLGAWPSLTTNAVFQVITKAATHGLTRPSRELLFTVISRDEKYRAKNAIDTIGYRFGDVAASWVNKGLAALGGGVLALATIPLVAIWLGLAVVLGIGFRRRAPAASARSTAPAAGAASVAPAAPPAPGAAPTELS